MHVQKMLCIYQNHNQANQDITVAKLAKKYNKTPYHLVELITEVTEDGWLYTKGERMEAAE